ncbi:MAG: peptidoglycan-binding protein LysM, partial [Clostridia bacterium]|nr:peptidoglycan-binding protein LysM [Clostridia bacterium]
MGLSNLKSKFMTRNDCYTAGRKITPKGIMVHSTATPGVMAADWFSRWNKS